MIRRDSKIKKPFPVGSLQQTVPAVEPALAVSAHGPHEPDPGSEPDPAAAAAGPAAGAGCCRAGAGPGRSGSCGLEQPEQPAGAARGPQQRYSAAGGCGGQGLVAPVKGF